MTLADTPAKASKRKDTRRGRRRYDRPAVCQACGMTLPRNRLCPRCRFGAALSYEEVAAIYNYRNPDDPEGPVTPHRVKVILQNIFNRLRSSVEREDSDVGRVLLGCLEEAGIRKEAT